MAILYVCGLCWLAMEFPWRSLIKQDEAMFCTYTGSQRKLISEKRFKLINCLGEYVATRGDPPLIYKKFGFLLACAKKKYLPHIKLHNRDGVPYQGLQNIWKDYFSHVKIKQVI